MKRGYINKAEDSFTLLRKNLTLFLPDIALTLTTILIGLGFLYYNNLLSPLISQDVDTFSNILQNIVSSTPKIINVLVSFAITALIGLMFGLSFKITKYQMIVNLLKNKKENIFKLYLRMQTKYFTKYFLLQILLFIIFLIPLLVLGGLSYLFNNNLLYIFSTILLLAIWIILRLLFFFSTPALFLDKQSVIKTLKTAYTYCLNNKKHTLYTFLIIIFISFIINILVNIAPASLPESLGFIILFTYILIKKLIDIGVSVWSTIFQFKNYKSK